MSYPPRLMFVGDGGANPFTIPGTKRTYLCPAGGVLLVDNGEDSRILQNQGWISSTGPTGAGSAGPTSARPRFPDRNYIYADTTLGVTLIWCGPILGWRNNMTGASPDGGGGGGGFDFSSLTTLPGGLSWGPDDIYGDPAIANFSNLTTANGISIIDIPDLTEVDFPVLTDAGSSTTIAMFDVPSLTTLSFNSLASFGDMLFPGGTDALTSMSFGAGFTAAGNISLVSCALNQASVNGLLQRLAAAVPSYTGRAVTITGTSAAPSGAGAAAKAALISAGNTVTTN